MSRKHGFAGALLACLTLALSSNSAAQDYRARIQGRVTDSTQAVIAGANVSLLNVKTGVRMARQTNETGVYLFDLIEPGWYSVTIEAAGFNKHVQENIEVQSRGDITVDASLAPGSVQESIVVSDSPVAVQFNSTNVALTIDNKLVNELPRFDRNPFKLSLLNPAAVNTRGELMPFHSWAANSLELGGGTNLKNDLQVDGSPIGVGHKASYTPAPESVQEVNIMQNSVDAESGHSAGGVVSMIMKSGTNEWHGNLFYIGRYPKLNAVTDRTINSFVASRNNMFGGTIGNPILKNKLFNFFSYEQWLLREPLNYLRTMPTERQRQGDFTDTLNPDGVMKPIFDPMTTVLDTAANRASRTPFPGNRIPAARFDPVSAKMMEQLWTGNNPGDNLTGVNNLKTTLTRRTDYWNISNRTDYNLNDRWRLYGRYSKLHTMVDSTDPSPNQSPLYVTQGASARHALSVSGDAIWTVTPNTIVNFHGDYHSLVDDYDSPRDKLEDGWASIWGSNRWYAPYSESLPPYYPRIQIGGSQFGQATTHWYQHPNGNSFNVKLAQQRGAHYFKIGFDTRRSGGISLVTQTTLFTFQPALTADTFISPNTRNNGSDYATFLLGVLDPNSFAITKPIKKPRNEFYAAFFQDDFKLNSRLTLNLGLRYEFEPAWYDADYRMSRYLDLNAPIREFQSNPPVVPAAVLPYMKSQPVYNGAWIFTDSSHPGAWEPGWTAFGPRAGIALRITDTTSLRAGYARYPAPTEFEFVDAPFSGSEALNFLEPPMLGFDARQAIAPVLQGIPQARLSDPFPSATNPLLPPKGKGYGPYLGLGGDNLVWFYQDNKRRINDRLNVSLQQQLPNQIVLDVTYFANFGHNLGYTNNLNQTDPMLNYTHKAQLAATVRNPFYNYLTAEVVPGPARNQQNVTIGSLLRPYPQYGGLYEINTPDRLERYHSLQLKAQRAFRGGYNFLFGYVYVREKSSDFFDDIATYNKTFTFLDSTAPRHRISAAGTYELPFGRGRKHLSDVNAWLDGALGGWQVVGAWYFTSGDTLSFGTMIAEGDPRISNPAPDRWFNTSVFSQQPAYTPRSNPKQYSGLNGPIFWDLQGSISKQFRISEQKRVELKVGGYNVTNRLNRANPDVGVLSSNFGRTLRQRSPGTVGRQLEVGLKILF
jgi:type 1 fimbria pilin